MKERTRTILTGAIIMAGGVALFLSALSIPPGNSLSKGGDFLPKIMAALLGLCGGGFLLSGLLSKSTATAEVDESTKMGKQQWKMFGVEFVLLFLYLLLLKPVGFMIMTTVYIFLQAWIITVPTERKPLRMLVIAVVVSVITYLVFVKGFKLLLPAGILG